MKLIIYHNATKTFKFDKFVNVMFLACLGSALNVLWLFVCESWQIYSLKKPSIRLDNNSKICLRQLDVKITNEKVNKWVLKTKTGQTDVLYVVE